MSKKAFIDIKPNRKTARIHVCSSEYFTFKRIRKFLDDADACSTARAVILGNDGYRIIYNRDADIWEYPINGAAYALTGNRYKIRGGAVIAKEIAPGVFDGIDLNTAHKIKKLLELREEIVNGEKT